MSIGQGGTRLYGPDGFGSTLDWARTIAQLAVDVEEMRSDELRGILAKVVATSPVVKGGLPVVDGYQTLGTDVVLLTAQASPVDNGPWLVGPSSWSRPTSFSDGSQVTGGTVSVTGGATLAGTVWTLQTTTAVSVGADAQTWISNPAVAVGTPTSTDPSTLYYQLLDIVMGYHVIGGSRYPAVRNGGSGTAKAAVQAAMAAAGAASAGGTVFVPDGEWDVADLALTWPEFNVTAKQIHLRGAGKYISKLKFSTDVAGTGSYAIAGNYAGGALTSAQGGLYENSISDLTIQGPGLRPSTMGTSPANLNGVMLDTHVSMHRVRILGFHYSLNSAGNHNTLVDCTLGNSYYSIYWTAIQGLGGDVNMWNCDLAGALHSSHAVAANAVASFHMFQGHCGFAPYAVYFEAGRTAGSLGLNHCAFVATSIEALGNGLFYSEDENAFVDDVYLSEGANFSIFSTYTLPGTTFTTAVRLYGWTNTTFQRCSGLPQGTASYLDVSTTLSGVAFHNCTSASGGAPFRFIATTPVLGPTSGSIAVRDNDAVGTLFPVGTYDVTAGDLVERTQFGPVRPHGAAGTGARLPIVGFASNTVTANSRSWVYAVQEARAFDVLVDGAEANGNQVYVPSSTNPSHVMAIAWDGTIGTATRPIVATLYFAGLAGAGKTRANVKIAA